MVGRWSGTWWAGSRRRLALVVHRRVSRQERAPSSARRANGAGGAVWAHRGEREDERLIWSTADGPGLRASTHREEPTISCQTRKGQRYNRVHGRSLIVPPILCAGRFQLEAVICKVYPAGGGPRSATNA